MQAAYQCSKITGRGDTTIMENWDNLRFCLTLARHKTMSSAAQAMQTNTTTVSRRIEKLSTELDGLLFEKSGQQWATTPLADALVRLAEKIETELVEILQNRDVVQGQTKIRISAALTILQTEVMAVLQDLMSEFPAVDFEVSMFPASLAMGETDISLTYAMPADGRIVRAKVHDEDLMMYTCAYHKDRTEDWINIQTYGENPPWNNKLEEVFGHPARFSVHGLNIARQTMERVPLACVLPVAYASRYPHLVPDPGFGIATLPIWIGYHESRRHDPVLRDIVARVLEAIRGLPE